MFNLNLNLNLKFISISVSYGSQFKFYFILVFNFKLTSKATFFYHFKYLIWSMWPISANTNLVHNLFISFFEGNQPFKFFYTLHTTHEPLKPVTTISKPSTLLHWEFVWYERKSHNIYGEVQVLHPFASMLE